MGNGRQRRTIDTDPIVCILKFKSAWEPSYDVNHCHNVCKKSQRCSVAKQPQWCSHSFNHPGNSSQSLNDPSCTLHTPDTYICTTYNNVFNASEDIFCFRLYIFFQSQLFSQLTNYNYMHFIRIFELIGAYGMELPLFTFLRILLAILVAWQLVFACFFGPWRPVERMREEIL